MTRPTRIPLPDSDYLLALGQFAYSISYLEGMVLFDLPRLASFLPEGPTVENLAGQSTGTIGSRLVQKATSASAPRVRHYLATAGEVLVELAKQRNHALHARPSSTDHGDQVLNRWREGESFIVTTPWLTSRIELVEQKLDLLSRAREALRPDLLDG